MSETDKLFCGCLAVAVAVAVTSVLVHRRIIWKQ